MANKIDDQVERYAAHLAHKRGEDVAALRAYMRVLLQRAAGVYRGRGAARPERRGVPGVARRAAGGGEAGVRRKLLIRMAKQHPY